MFDHPATLFIIVFIFGMLLIVFVLVKKMGGSQQRPYEVRVLYFSAVTLSTIALIFFVVLGMYYFEGYIPEGANESPTAGKGKLLFERSIQILLPIVTLVLGNYFGSTRKDKNGE